MPKIEVQEQLTVPSVPARAAAASIMGEIAEKRGEWADFALYLNLGALNLPDVGYIAIPATIENVRITNEPRFQIAFKMQSSRMPDAFPVFDGAIGIDATGPSNASLWLAGDYTTPGGAMGSIFNQTVARGSADKTLRNMARDLADGINARVQQRELSRARYRVLFGGGD